MTVVARCTDCGHTHPLAHRTAVRGTTVCPQCDSPRYHTTRSDGGKHDETALVRDAVMAADNVGETTAERIAERYSTYAGLETATIEDLCEVRNVGVATAQRIARVV